MSAPPEPADPAEEGPDGGAPAVEDMEPALVEAVRHRVVALVAGALGALPVDELPTQLRRVAKFAPQRRARLGGPLIATHVATDPVLRQRLSEKIIEDAGELGAAVTAGTAPPAA